MIFKKHFLFLIIFLLGCTLCTKTQESNILSGKVIAVKDGDTIEILLNNVATTIRLAHIDCPEIKRGQPFGRTAKKYTSNLCFKQIVKIIPQSKDKYRRIVGVVINSKGINVNKELVKAGLAWHFKKYSHDKEYGLLENIARKNKIGLWANAKPIAPWEWRKIKSK